MIDLRFPTALQIMLSLALAEEEGLEPVSSAQLAEGLNTDSSVVRRLLQPLIRTGLVESLMGKNGGVRLGRPADKITLHDILSTVTSDKKIWKRRGNIPHRCVVSTYFDPFFGGIIDDTEDMMLELLSNRTLAQSLSQLHRMDERNERTSPLKSAELRIS